MVDNDAGDIMKVKKIVQKLVYKNRADSDTYIAYLRSMGMTIGERVSIYEPRTVYMDITRPFMIEIGNDVKITRGVTMLTHGYDWCVLAGLNDIVLGSAGGITIGNNVFIGMNTTILKGVHIGDNVVIGAGSLVNKDIPDNCVAAGNPCRVIMPIDEYYEKRQKAQLSEAFEVYARYLKRYGKEPPQEVFDEFFWLFHKRDEPLPAAFSHQMQWHGRYKQVYHHLVHTQPLFDGYDKFLAAARQACEQ